MPHRKNTQKIREISRSFEKNSENAMNDIVRRINDNEKFNKLINIAALRDTA